MHTDLFIDGRYRKALSGAAFEDFEPATGRALARAARGGKEDVEEAVAAAREAAERGPRPPYLAPEDAAERRKRRLPALEEIL